MIEVSVALQSGSFALRTEFSGPAAGVTAVFGPSGSGKSTLLAAIAGLARPERGRIAIDGHVLFDSETRIDLAPEKRRIGFVFQDFRLFPHLTVAGNLAYGQARAPRGYEIARFDDVVALLGLDAHLDRRPGSLSGGEKQRVAIGRALLSQPRLLLMDEPLASLDAPRRREILRYISRLKENLAVPIVYVSHAGEEIAALADHLVLIDNGRVTASGNVVEIFAHPDLSAAIMNEAWGVLVEGKIAGHDLTGGLSEVAFPGGRLKLPLIEARLGQKLRLRIPARDVILALAPADGLSVQNVIPAKVAEIREAGGGQVDIVLSVGPTRLVSRVTLTAMRRLGLAPGRDIYALIKSVAADRIG